MCASIDEWSEKKFRFKLSCDNNKNTTFNGGTVKHIIRKFLYMSNPLNVFSVFLYYH